MPDALPPDADAGSEPRPDAVSAAATGSNPMQDDLQTGEPGPGDPVAAPIEPGPRGPGAAPTEPVIPAPTGRRPPRRLLLVALGYLAAAVVGALLLGGSLVAVGGVGRAVPSPSPTPTPPPNVANGPSPRSRWSRERWTFRAPVRPRRSGAAPG